MKPADKMVREGDRERALLIEGSALALRANGYDYDEIAERLGIRRDAVSKAIKRGLKRHQQECAESAKMITEIESFRLDKLFHAAYAHVARGDIQGIAMAIKVMERRAKMLGLDKPVKTVNENVTKQVDISQNVSLEELKAIEEALSKIGVGPGADASDGEDDVDLGYDYPEANS